MLVLHKDSHVDHGIPGSLIELLCERFKDKDGFFIETVDIRDLDEWHRGLFVPLSLVGPAVGDRPVTEEEVSYQPRGNRQYNSRMLKKGSKGGYVRWRTTHTTQITIIAGPHDSQPCVLYTAFGGPLAPQEPDDPSCKDVDASKKFWAEHALAGFPE